MFVLDLQQSIDLRVVIIEIYGTMLGCDFKDFRSDIYRSAVDGIPYSSDSNLICLIATMWPSESVALKTLPNAP